MKERTRKRKKSILSSNPYKRRDESEMIKIVKEIQAGEIGKREACRKYGLSRNTLNNWIGRLSVSLLEKEPSHELPCGMTELQQDKALRKKVKELTKALEQANLKTESLETIIRVAEEELHIKIRKKRGTKQREE